MKSGWEIKKLVEIVDVSTGKYDANHASENGKYRFYTCAYNFGMCNTNRFSGESLILPGNGVNVGEVFYYNGEFDAYQRTYIINNIKIFPKYLHYHMLLYWKELGTKLQYGSATNFIKIGNFQNYDVSYPTFSEQQHIVAILDEAFAAIAKAKANAEQNLKNAKELFESYLQSVFENGKLKVENGEWEEKKLGEVCEELFAGGDVPKNDSFKFKTDDYSIPIFSNGEKNKGLYGYTNVARVTKPSITISARGTIGYSEIRNEHFYPAIRLIVVTPKKEFINLAYLKYVISGIDFKHSGSSIPQLTVPMIKEYPISFPSIKEQQTIVKKLDALSTETKKLETIYQNKIQDLEELKKSILQKAFAGELKVDNGELKMKKKLSAV